MAAASASTPAQLPETIDQVLHALDEIVNWCWEQKSRLGYFAALCRRVTQAVKQGIDQGKFQNGQLMERLDVTFCQSLSPRLPAIPGRCAAHHELAACVPVSL